MLHRKHYDRNVVIMAPLLIVVLEKTRWNPGYLKIKETRQASIKI